MAFIGNQPISVAFLTDTFSGTGAQVAFTMTVAPANTSSIIVAVTGVVQDPSTYSVSGTTLTFSAAPPSGTSNISVRYLGIPASGVTTTAYRTVTDFTATAAQTSFSVPSYTVGYIDVYRNGVRLVSTDFTATTGTTVVLVNACTVGDSVVTESFLVSSVLNAIPNTAGSVSSSNIVSGVTLTNPVISSITNTGTLTLPTTTGTLALQSDGIGFSQTWQVITGSRALSTTYYNTTGKPIMAFVRLSCGPGEVQGAYVVVNGVGIGAGSSAANGQSQVTFIVPPSQSYEVQANSGSPTLGTWAELR